MVLVACGDDAAPDDDGQQGGAGGGGSPTTTSTMTSTGGAAEATIGDACEGLSNYDAVCYEDPDFDVASCNAAGACFPLIYRDDAEQPMLDCFAGWATAPTCNEWCSDQVAPSLTPAPAHTAHEASCAAYEKDCGHDGGDICGNPVVQLEPAIVAIITECLDGECAALESCLEDAVGDYLASCGGETGGLW